MEDEDAYYIYTVESLENGKGIIRRNNVTRGSLTGKGIILTDGVKEGMRVLIAGMSRVHKGQKVRVK